MSRFDIFAALPEEAKSPELWRMLELMSEPIIVDEVLPDRSGAACRPAADWPAASAAAPNPRG